MSKNLKAFLNKNKSKAGAKAAEAKKDESAQAAQLVGNDKQVEDLQKAQKRLTNAKQGDSSDEEVEDDIDLDVQYGNIKDTKDIVTEETTQD